MDKFAIAEIILERLQRKVEAYFEKPLQSQTIDDRNSIRYSMAELKDELFFLSQQKE
jgi:hypothetical protein